MLSFVALQFLVLLAAAVTLAVEARTGTLEGETEHRTFARALVFLLATIAGTTLLLAVSRAEWLFALALTPITFLCLLRFAMLARRWWTGWRLPVLTAALLGLGVFVSIPWVPHPLDRTSVLREVHGVEALHGPDTIDPEALHPVRS